MPELVALAATSVVVTCSTVVIVSASTCDTSTLEVAKLCTKPFTSVALSVVFVAKFTKACTTPSVCVLFPITLFTVELFNAAWSSGSVAFNAAAASALADCAPPVTVVLKSHSAAIMDVVNILVLNT